MWAKRREKRKVPKGKLQQLGVTECGASPEGRRGFNSDDVSKPEQMKREWPELEKMEET